MIICVLSVAALVVLKTVSRKSAIVTQEMPEVQPTKKSSADKVALRSRAEQVTPAPRIVAPETTKLVFTAYVATATGLVPVLRTQAPSARVWTPEEAQAARESTETAREQWRQELKMKDEYKETFAKEAEWKEKSKAIATGMTLQEVVAVMGLPTQTQVFVEMDKEHDELTIVPNNTLANVTGLAFVRYDPDGKQPSLGESLGAGLNELPFDHLFLSFDNKGRLEVMSWGKAGLLATTVSTSIKQNIGQQQNSSPSSPVAAEPVTSPKQ